MKNILSIDVEEVFHGEYTREHRGKNPVYRTPYNIPTILELLRKYDVKATFFVVGEIAEKYPEVIKFIKEEGHEVAFHGYYHIPLWRLNPQTFREEVTSFKRLVPDCIGFRAPSFSLNNNTKWALNVLKDEGFRYDSSVFPAWTPLYGVYDAPLKPYYPSSRDISKESDRNDGIIEFPLTVYDFLGLRLPTAGGFWLRFLNIGLIKRSIKKLNEKGWPSILYIHNWELDFETPKLKLSFPKSFVTYHNLDKARDTFTKLLNDFHFTSIMDCIKTQH
ncbi:MAG: polysaccharide deacetylase family protein [Candidatus Bathyarchaeia archaeon]